MALLSKIFGKKGNENNLPKGFYELEVKAINRITKDAVHIVLNVPENLKSTFSFIPGQYLNFNLVIDGKELRRSYSICSAPQEDLAVGVKQVQNGTVSAYFNQELKVGDVLQVAKPEGNFLLDKSAQNVVAFASGSGITPILSMAKVLNAEGRKMNLYYGNKTSDTAMFMNEINGLEHVKVTNFYSAQNVEGYKSGRIDKENLNVLIKEDLNILKADAFYLCGPEEMIMTVKATLEAFGVSDKKIHFELFSTPVKMESNDVTAIADFKGISKISVILDDEKINIELASDGKTILEALDQGGYDAPYSCRGGVCCTCKAKVLEGNVKMKLNYSLTDEEVRQGYILSCQAHPASEVVSITYDI